MSRKLSREELSALSERTVDEALEILQTELRRKQRTELKTFARYVQVPGAPGPDDAARSDLQRVLAAKRTKRMPKGVSGKTDAKSIREDIQANPEFFGLDDPDEAKPLYPLHLDPARHHDVIMETLQGVIEEDIVTPGNEPVDGVMFFMPPGSAKSTYSSMVAPGFFMSKYANYNVIGVSFAQQVANRFSRRARAVVSSPSFRAIFPEIELVTEDVQNWEMNNGSEYRASGVMGAVTSFRADLLIVDDPVAGREEAESDVISEKTFEAYNDDLRTRLKPGGKQCLIMTRWAENDLAGRILGEGWNGQSGHWKGTPASGGKNWYIVCLPMVAEHKDDPLGRAEGDLLWPEWFNWREVDGLRKAAKAGGIAARTWSSLYQQRPAPVEGNILLRQYWRKWPKKDKDGQPIAPECDFIMLAYDTAIEDDEQADYTAMSAWGCFQSTASRDEDEYNHPHVIMLGAWRAQLQAADLADKIEEHWRYFKTGMTNIPRIIIEKRASGAQVIQELQRRRLPVRAWLPRGRPGAKGKVPRAHGVAMMMEQGAVWYIPGDQTEKVIDECAAFPNATHDDWTDTVTMALAYMRDHFWFRTISEEMTPEEREAYLLEQRRDKHRKRSLYGRTIDSEVDESPFENLTERSRRSIYGGQT